MPSPLDRQPHDLAVRQMAPLSPTDLRVPTAEEFDLDSKIGIQLFRASRSEHQWLDRPSFEMPNPGRVGIEGLLLPIGSPTPIAIDTQIVIPPLADTFTQVDRRDSLHFVGFTAEVGELEDPLLGQFSYGFPGGVMSLAKENTRRYRYFWVLCYRIGGLDLDVSDIIAAIGASKSLPVDNLLDVGFSRSGYQFYAKDPHLTAGKTYKILPDTIDILPILAVDRRQNLTLNGYSYGLNGESATIDALSNLATRSDREYAERMSEISSERLLEIASGRVGKLGRYTRAVINFSVGANPGNPGYLGISALSPNGSHATANDQRIAFTNQPIVETRQAYPVTATLAANGNILIATGLNTNAPPGSIFSGDKTLHKIYKSDGTEQSQYGTWSNLAGTGGLQWLGTSNSSLVEGETAYVVPAVEYPAGSGFELPFLKVERAWRNAVPIAVENLRVGWEDDLSAYDDPAAGEDYILVFGAERLALHYIYRKVSVTIGANGVATLPSGVNGCFAFIDGVSGRIDSPTRSGLPPGTRNALIYHAPDSADTWQIQVRYPEYQGLDYASIPDLAGGIICGESIVCAHSQGGGGSVFGGELATRYRPIAFHLPDPGTGIPSYTLDTPIQLAGEEYRGPISWREIELLSATAGVMPTIGSTIAFGNQIGTYKRSINAKVTSQEEPLSFYAPLLANRKPYQIVVMIPIRTEAGYYSIIATKNTVGGENILLDPATGTGIDIFYL